MSKLKVIYEPTGPAREFAALALNIYKGCTHRCIYCYNNRWPRKKGDFFKSSWPRSGLNPKIVADCKILSELDNCPEVLLSFIGDVYQPAEKSLGLTRLAIKFLIQYNIPFTILTKSHLVSRDFDLLAPYRDNFRLGMTFTTIDHHTAANWEPGASHPLSRILTLSKARQEGIKTWVSLEPVMSAATAIDVVAKTHHIVDFYWVGKLNHHEPPEPVDWSEARTKIKEALDHYHCKYRFKKSFLEV